LTREENLRSNAELASDSIDYNLRFL